MQWEVLIIPLIALGVWILGTLLKSDDEKAKPGVRRPNGSGRTPARRPVTNLDQFLDEARRRREAEARPKTPSAPPVPRATVARPVLREPPARPSPKAPRVAPLREAVPVAKPTARPVAQVDVVEVVPEAPPAPPAPRAVQPTPIVKQVRSLLSQPQTAGTAFVLREIFDRPLCQRRR